MFQLYIYCYYIYIETWESNAFVKAAGQSVYGPTYRWAAKNTKQVAKRQAPAAAKPPDGIYRECFVYVYIYPLLLISPSLFFLTLLFSYYILRAIYSSPRCRILWLLRVDPLQYVAFLSFFFFYIYFSLIKEALFTISTCIFVCKRSKAQSYTTDVYTSKRCVYNTL